MYTCLHILTQGWHLLPPLPGDSILEYGESPPSFSKAGKWPESLSNLLLLLESTQEYHRFLISLKLS